MKQVFSFFLVLHIGVVAWSQSPLDSIQQLDEIVLKSDSYLQTFSDTQLTSVLKDSVLTRSASSLTQLLNNNGSIYFKENGLGMVSSPSFRGTTAQQTAVIWNGININSQFNGQTDFNTINIRNFNNITVRSGGGSVLYGSGAIGGSVHLNNNLKFNSGFQNKLYASYGSFNTLDLSYNGSMSTDKFSVEIGLSRTSSSNDYPYVDSDKTNLNGQFYNATFSANVGYKINNKNVVKLYSYLFDSDRHFSLIFPSETPTKYQDFNTRNLLEWQGFYGRFISTMSLAHITEKYKYFPNIEKENFSFGEAKSFIGKYQLDYKILKNASLQGVMDLKTTTGEGSDIAKNERTISSFSLLFKQTFNKFLYEASLRKELTNNYESPLLYSLGLQYRVTPNYRININGSKNFRIPTYNDLYWFGSGNLELNPETSYQIELGNELTFNKLSFSVVAYYNDIKNMIRWLPNGSIWTPINTDQVLSYGLEAKFQFEQQFQAHKISLSSTYAYTVSENKETKKQLIYVPYHKATASLNYQYKRVSAYYQMLYVGEVFTLSDNNPKYILDAYLLSNAGAEYAFGKHLNYTVGIQFENLFNVNYQAVVNRYMPGNNYNFYINLNF
ncbi:TonB-dependent receptor plug domain-containing protein [Xanthomarina sp. F2636L]|uniref:TonB-dependent receptor plug domain-containing protein n=1 Tax=Xanthomarina sp. F2636L TaxID=2996018 RepID=UPI00225E4C00|nr:TonB-dependent receptor [Xanthomarina sp. F2636L]MCX7550197.1 TonB-dependent receptor [Xanthomarina sp. F2636L]